MENYCDWECERCGDVRTRKKNSSRKRFEYCFQCGSCRNFHMININKHEEKKDA